MTLEDFIDLGGRARTRRRRADRVLLPETTPEYLAELKGRARGSAWTVSGTAVGNDFCVTDADKDEAARRWTTSSSGWSTRRAGRQDHAHLRRQRQEGRHGGRRPAKRCIAAIQEACDHAAKYGVIPGAGEPRRHHRHGRADAGDRQGGQARLVRRQPRHGQLPHAPTPTPTWRRPPPTRSWCRSRPRSSAPATSGEDADLKRLTDILRNANYRGYVALEYEAKEDPKTAVPKAIAELKKYMD